ncbi:MAG: hypothetical protein QW567_01120 [Candidatus Hadarchaeales archaeon]
MDLIRIFKAIMTALIIVVFILLLFSAYQHYRFAVSTAGLIDATSTAANDLVLNDLALREGGTVVAYVIDPTRIDSLSFSKLIGGENLAYRIELSSAETTWIGGPVDIPEGREACSMELPVVIFENFRHVPGRMRVVLWRA